MKKNILGMDMTEWKHLSGLADPYKLALAEAGVEAGVPPVVESKAEVAEDHDDDIAASAAQAQNKEARLIAIKRAARNLRGKTRNAAEKAATTPAKDRYKTTLELAKHRKAFVKGESIEDLDPEIMWAVYLEDIGSSAEEFGKLLDIAIESDDEDMAIELIAIEDQLDELLGAKPAQPKGMVAGAQAAGKQAAGVATAAVKPPVVAPAAGGGAVAGVAPAAGAPPAAPAGAVAPAAPPPAATAAAPAAAPATGSPAGVPKKMGLLGTLGRGMAKVAGGVGAAVGSAIPKTKPAAAPVAAAPAAAAPAPKKEDLDEWEEFIAEEFDMTAEQYVEMFDQAIEEDDQDILGNAHQIDEIFAAWRAKKAAAAQEKHSQTMDKWKAARAVVAKHGTEATKAASVRGKQVGAPPAGSGTSVYAKKAESVEDIASQIMESSGYTPKAKPSTIKDLMGDQLRFSGYTDEHIARKRG